MKNKILNRYLISIICFILAIVKVWLKDKIILPKISFDCYTIMFIIMGIVLLFYQYIIYLLKQCITLVSIRITVALFCFCLVILKMFKGDFIIDNTSIYLILIATIVVLIPDLKDTIDRVKKIKKGDFELEFSLQSLLTKVETVEQEKNKEMKNDHNLNYIGLDKDISEKIEHNLSDPHALILILGVEIEKRVTELANNYEIGINNYITYIKLIDELENVGAINHNQKSLFHEFRKVRNIVVHGRDDNMNSKQLYEFVELGLRILKTLPSKAIK